MNNKQIADTIFNQFRMVSKSINSGGCGAFAITLPKEKREILTKEVDAFVKKYKDDKLSEVKELISRITISLFGIKFNIRVQYDNKGGDNIFIQINYTAPCNKTGIEKQWSGRKYYLSSYMTEDEIIKTAWVAYRSCIEHEVMETFRVDDLILFNPHTPYTELLKISEVEVKRDELV